MEKHTRAIAAGAILTLLLATGATAMAAGRGQGQQSNNTSGRRQNASYTTTGQQPRTGRNTASNISPHIAGCPYFNSTNSGTGRGNSTGKGLGIGGMCLQDGSCYTTPATE